MTSIHYGTPSSLPSDYALLSRYAIDDTDDDDDHPIRPLTRRTSCPFPYLQPEHFSPKIPMPDEYTPLLVPRIQEEDSTKVDPSSPKIYRDELRILTKYTLPVFGYAFALRP